VGEVSCLLHLVELIVTNPRSTIHQFVLDLQVDPSTSGTVPLPDTHGYWPFLHLSELSDCNPDQARSAPDQDDASGSPYVQVHLALDNLECADGSQVTLPTPPHSIPKDLMNSPYLLQPGAMVQSPGGHFTYRILGACCRLFDREELPWPCCRIQWRSKEPSWRRIGKRFVPDLATKRSPSYAVEIIDHDYAKKSLVVTFYWVRLPESLQNWWYQRYVPSAVQHRHPQE